jgi:hypothetical protein
LHAQALGIFRRVADGQLGLIVTPIVVAELVSVARSLLGWTRQVTAQRLGSKLTGSSSPKVPLSPVPSSSSENARGWTSRTRTWRPSRSRSARRTVASYDADIDVPEGVRRISA